MFFHLSSRSSRRWVLTALLAGALAPSTTLADGPGAGSMDAETMAVIQRLDAPRREKAIEYWSQMSPTERESFRRELNDWSRERSWSRSTLVGGAVGAGVGAAGVGAARYFLKTPVTGRAALIGAGVAVAAGAGVGLYRNLSSGRRSADEVLNMRLTARDLDAELSRTILELPETERNRVLAAWNRATPEEKQRLKTELTSWGSNHRFGSVATSRGLATALGSTSGALGGILLRQLFFRSATGGPLIAMIGATAALGGVIGFGVDQLVRNKLTRPGSERRLNEALSAVEQRAGTGVGPGAGPGATPVPAVPTVGPGREPAAPAEGAPGGAPGAEINADDIQNAGGM